MMRGTTRFGDRDYFARTGTWHSGVITSIHRIGWVGLGIISCVYLYGAYLVFRNNAVVLSNPNDNYSNNRVGILY